MKHCTRCLGLTVVLSVILLAIPGLLSAEPVVRVLFYSGNVTIKSAKGQQLQNDDVVAIGSGSTLQLSINGKVLKYDTKMDLKVADAIKRAQQGENSVVANTVRTIAGASGAGRDGRTSVAGATRVNDSSEVIEKTEADALGSTSDKLNEKLANETGIENPLGMIGEAAKLITGETVVIVEPRSTAVPEGPISFRWRKTPDAKKYNVSVTDYMGDVIFRAESTDTLVVWNDPELYPEAVYNWTITKADNSFGASSASFHQLPMDNNEALLEELGAVQTELGEDNPALPMIMGGVYSGHGCYGHAARHYMEGARQTPEHYETLMGMAFEEYRENMYVTEEEAAFICGE